MSTHAIIAVEGNPSGIYLHSDGYPSAVLPLLVPFLAAFIARRGHDAEYLLARTVQHVGNALDARSAEITKRIGGAPGSLDTCLGLGLSSEYPGDIRWAYFVSADGVLHVFKTFLFDVKVAVLRKVGESPQGRSGFTRVESIDLCASAKSTDALALLGRLLEEKPEPALAP